MEKLYEYNDLLSAPYEVFIDGVVGTEKGIKPHWHYYTEIIYVLEGTAVISSDNKIIKVSKGDLFLFFPRSIHTIDRDGKADLVYRVIKFDINKLNVTNSYTPKLSSLLTAAKEKFSGHFTREMLSEVPIDAISSDCLKEFEEKKYGFDLLLQSRLTFLLVSLVRVWRAMGLNLDIISNDKQDDRTIFTITEYIDEHSGEPMNIQFLAKKCNMSYSYFAREFKRLYGRSCKEYIEFIKTSKVENLLMFTDFDLNYISQETGFSDSSHLIKVFRKHKGITPKQFKKMKNKL